MIFVGYEAMMKPSNKDPHVQLLFVHVRLDTFNELKKIASERMNLQIFHPHFPLKEFLSKLPSLLSSSIAALQSSIDDNQKVIDGLNDVKRKLIRR